jgi:hypothetical protein
MKRITIFLALLATGLGSAHAAPDSTNHINSDRILMVDPSSASVAAGRATLTIGALLRTNDLYTGNYKIKVFPYFFKNEKGTLTVFVSDATLAGINAGKVAVITGTATTSGKGGRTRHIDVTATPMDINQGKLKLCFITASNRKLIFEPAYHFAGTGMALALAHTTETNF